ncbi:MAG TPA: hypothetical protein VJH63_03315 [Candidatus Paceibacterota bacterium]
MNDQPNINQDQPQDPFVDLRTSVSGEQSVLELQRRKDSFTDLGFSDEFVSNLSEKYPKLSTEHNLSVKLKDLTDAGFENPVALIEKFPAILGLSFKENITPKLELVADILDLYDINSYTANQVFESLPPLFGLKRARISMTARILKDHINEPKSLMPRQLASLLIQAPENILISVFKSDSKLSAANAVSRIGGIKKSYKTKEDKRTFLSDLFRRNPKDKLLRKYFNTYPMKE